MWIIQKRKYRDGIDNLLVLLIGGIPIAMPTVLSVTMALGSHTLSHQVSKLVHAFVRYFLVCCIFAWYLIPCVVQGAITKRITAIEEMAGMDILCSDKTGTLTLNKLTVDKSIVEVGH